MATLGVHCSQHHREISLYKRVLGGGGGGEVTNYIIHCAMFLQHPKSTGLNNLDLANFFIG